MNCRSRGVIFDGAEALHHPTAEGAGEERAWGHDPPRPLSLPRRSAGLPSRALSNGQRSTQRSQHRLGKSTAFAGPLLPAEPQDRPPPLLCAPHRPAAPLRERATERCGAGRADPRRRAARKPPVAGCFVVIVALPRTLLANPVIYYLCAA